MQESAKTKMQPIAVATPLLVRLNEMLMIDEYSVKLTNQ
jgi:hypothetical protein